MKQNLLVIILILSAFWNTSGYAQTLYSSSPTNSYCQGTTGVTFRVENTVAGNSYILQQLISSVWTGIDTIHNAVAPIDYFQPQCLSGSYRLKSTTSTIIITQTNLPENLFTVTVSIATGGKLTTTGAGYCVGSTIYPSIGLSGSQSGILYKLYKDGNYYFRQHTGTVTGGPFLFLPAVSDSGTYTVIAERNGCTRSMDGSKTIVIFPVPTVTFTPTFLGPPDNCGAVTFTPSISYPPPPPLNTASSWSYNWSFGTTSNPPTSTLINPTCQFPAYGINTQSFSVSMLVTDNNGCSDTFTDNVIVQQRPDARIDASFWNNCNSSPTANFILTIVNKTTTPGSNTGYLIDWDDPDSLTLGGVYYTPAQFPFDGLKTHVYTRKGSFHLKVTAIGPASTGCNDTKIYPVFNGSTPTGGITYASGILEGCSPHEITFWLSGDAQDNAPTTYYFFNFGDGTPDTTFTQETMPPMNSDGKYHISHIYQSVSCGQPGQSFTLTHYIENPCSRIPNDVGGIKISEKSFSDFLRTEFPLEPIYVCEDVPRVYTNETHPGCIIYGGSVYNTTTYSWDFFNDGTIESTVASPTFTFPDPGLFEIKLTSFTGQSIPGNCGDSPLVRPVCVQATPVSSFTMPGTLCVNNAFTPVNNSYVGPPCAVPHYQWTITPNSGYVYENGTNSTSFQPTLNFTQAGVYTIRLTVAVFSGNVSCNSTFHEETISIVGTPSIAITPDTVKLCGPGVIGNLSSIVTYNANLGTITNYLWAVSPSGPVISDPTIQYPTVTIPDDITQNYSLTVTVTNECGVSTSIPLIINVTQTITNNAISYTPTPPASLVVCSGMTLSALIVGNVPSGGNGVFTYKWYIQEGGGPWNELAGKIGRDLNYTLPLTADPTKFKRKATSGNCFLESDAIVLTVTPGIQTNTISSPQSICSGTVPSSFTGSTPTQGSGTYTYKWQQSNDAPLFVTWVDSPVPNDGIHYIQGALSQTTRYRRIVYSGVCELTSNVIEVTVNPIPSVTSATAKTICSGSAVNYQIISTLPGTLYQWIVNDLSGGDITGYNNYTGGPLSLISDILVNNSAVPKDIQYVITPTATSVPPCQGSSFVLTVTVRPAFQSTYTNSTINVGMSTTLAGTISGGTSGYTYLWQPDTELKPGNSTLPNPETVLLYAQQNYTLTVTDAASCTFVQQVTVNTSGTLLAVALSALPGQIVCEGDTIIITATATGGSGNNTFTWGGLPPGTIYLQPWKVKFVPALIGINNYTVDVYDGFTTDSANISITVNEIPSVTSVLLKQICSGEDIDYTPTSNIAGTKFNWSRSANVCITASPAVNNGTVLPNAPISSYLSNICHTVETVNYTITPIGPAPTNCMGTPVTLVVNVEPVASIVSPAVNSQTVVSGFPTTAVTFTSDVAAAGIHWKYQSATCAGFVSGYSLEGYTSTIPVDTIILSPGAPATCTVTYQVVPYVMIAIGDTCWGNPHTYSYIIKSEPIKYDIICPAPICQGQTATISLSYSDVGINYMLYRNGTAQTPFKPGIDGQLDWAGIGVAGLYTIKATNPTNGVSVFMNNPCDMVVNPLPLAYMLVPQGDTCY
ncbi:MAG: PKD-like domain-containing protein, partial [Bacteroidota bacterium]